MQSKGELDDIVRIPNLVRKSTWDLGRGEDIPPIVHHDRNDQPRRIETHGCLVRYRIVITYFA
jgi:hypothetical protein